MSETMDPIAQYKQNAVTTQSPGVIIVMLYEGAIRSLSSAEAALKNHDYGEFAECMSRAGNIIDELDVALDMDRGGQIAANLRSLYEFLRRHLLKAQIQKDAQMIKESVSLLQDLYEGWKSIT